MWNWEEAEKAYTRALDLNPSNALAHKGYGELLSVLGRHDDAIAEAGRALQLDPLSLLRREPGNHLITGLAAMTTR